MSDSPKIVPSRISSSCEEMWGELRSVPQLFIPYMEAEQIYGAAGAVMDCRNLLVSMNEQATRDALDSLSWSTPDSGRVALLFTDTEVIPRGMIPMAVDAAVALERFYFSPRELAAIVFNPPDNEATHFSYSVKKFYLPRLIGMLRTEHPWQGDAQAHSRYAVECYGRDRIFEALHHAALAREMGASADEYFFTEIHCLINCSLWENVQQYLRWYESREVSSPRLELLRARMLSISGQPGESLKILGDLAETHQLEELVWLERGRANLIDKNPTSALEAFDQCLKYSPQNWDALLGRGIAIRSLHYQTGEREWLLEAKKSFDAVSAAGGLHAAEALHHAGTICGRLMMAEEAVTYYRQALLTRYSSVSRMNLALLLKTMGSTEEAVSEFQLLDSLDRTVADNIREHFAGSEMSILVQREEPAKQLSPQLQVEQFQQQSLAAFEQIKSWKIPLKGDLMDFRRVDEFFSQFAPQGVFSEQCVFHGLPESEVGPVLLTLAQHLAGVLVRRRYARWATGNGDETYGASIIFTGNSALKEPFNFFVQTIRRYEAGANQDNLNSLEFMIAHLSDYSAASVGYQSPWKKERASDALLTQWKTEAKWVTNALRAQGYDFDGTMDDLALIDAVIEDVYESPNCLKDEDWIRAALGEDARKVTLALGLHLGFVVQSLTEGVWYNHNSGSGIYIDECLLTPVHPVRKIEERLLALGGDLTLAGIATLVSPLACAHLARKVQKHEIETREDLKRLLCAAVPSLMEDDPTGTAVERMTALIEAQAGEIGLLQ